MCSTWNNSFSVGLEKQALFKKKLHDKTSLKEVNPLPLERNDVFLCVSNMLSLTTNFLINQGIRGTLLLDSVVKLNSPKEQDI